MAVGRIKRLLAVAGAAGCLGLLGGLHWLRRIRAAGRQTEQDPSGSGADGFTPPRPGPEPPTGGPHAIPGSRSESRDGTGQRPPAESGPPTGLGTRPTERPEVTVT